MSAEPPLSATRLRRIRAQVCDARSRYRRNHTGFSSRDEM
jgi:hypothetical protein